jgi:hypothetical protein
MLNTMNFILVRIGLMYNIEFACAIETEQECLTLQRQARVADVTLQPSTPF